MHQSKPVRVEIRPEAIVPVSECLVCGHVMPLGVWKEVKVWNPAHKESGVLAEMERVGVCEPCRDAAMHLRGACSPERGCRCEPAN